MRSAASLILLLIPLSAPAAHQAQPKGRDNAPMVRVAGGAAVIGSETGEPDERPLKTVPLHPYWIDQHEVTNAQYARFCRETGHKPPVTWQNAAPPPGRELWPVVNVTWSDAAAYAKWAGKRLPTEAEWEFAARGTARREYPWGDLKPDRTRAALDDETALGPVGRYPDGASPCGAMDMAGNAWEWTADWYDRYGSPSKADVSAGFRMVMESTYPAASSHFGTKYKVVRGGGAIGFFGIPNSGRAADRARLLPFARSDAVGFRCVMDEGTPQPFDTDISAAFVRTVPQKQKPDHTAQRTLPITVTEPAGTARRAELVTTGVPLPVGALKNGSGVRLLDEKGAEIPLMIRTSVKWKDGSIKWLLLDFPVTVGAGATRRLQLQFGDNVKPHTATPAETAALKDTSADAYNARNARLEVDGRPLEQPTVSAAEKDRAQRLEFAGQRLWVEKPGSTDFIGANFVSLFSLTARSVATVGSRVQSTVITLAQVSDKPSLKVTLCDFPLLTEASLKAVIFGGDGGPVRFPLKPGDRYELRQRSADLYEVLRNGKAVARGTRSAGWITAVSEGLATTFAVRDFAQQHPLTFVADSSSVILRMVSPDAPMEFARGMRKSLEIMSLEAGENDSPAPYVKAYASPLTASIPPGWIAASRAMGALHPYDLRRFPEFETLAAHSAEEWIRSRPTGIRNWGDAAMAGDAKGRNSFTNLEYDIPYCLFLQYARTGLRRYLDAGIQAAKHQIDIDTNYLTGQPWKHGPMHTQTPADLGHVFVRGLITYTCLTGDPRGLDTARKIASYIRTAIGRPAEVGNERQIGWALLALTAVQQATGDERLQGSIDRFVAKLIEGQSPDGCFDIKYDNRTAFFNGLAMSGLIAYIETAGDEKAADAVLRLADRTLGLYPDYAGRTIDAYTWCFDRTGDPRFATAAVRAWETTVERAQAIGWDLPATLFSVHYHPWAVRNGLANATVPSAPGADEASSEDGRRLTHLTGTRAALVITDPAGSILTLTILGHRVQGAVSLVVTDISLQKPRPVAKMSIDGSLGGASVAPMRLILPGGKAGRKLKVLLEADFAAAWDVMTDRNVLRTVPLSKPADAVIRRLTPRLWFKAAGTAVKVAWQASGHGFHGAVLRNAEDRVVAVGNRFIEMEDKTAHTHQMVAPVDQRQRGQLWSLELVDADLLTIMGGEALFATSRRSHPAAAQPSAGAVGRTTR